MWLLLLHMRHALFNISVSYVIGKTLAPVLHPGWLRRNEGEEHQGQITLSFIFGAHCPTDPAIPELQVPRYVNTEQMRYMKLWGKGRKMTTALSFALLIRLQLCCVTDLDLSQRLVWVVSSSYFLLPFLAPAGHFITAHLWTYVSFVVCAILLIS